MVHPHRQRCEEEQRLFNRRRLKKCSLSPKTLTNFYRCTIESNRSGGIIALYGNCTAYNCRARQRVVRSAKHITWGDYLSSRTPTAPNITGRPKS